MYEIIKSQKNKEISLKKLAIIRLYGKIIEVNDGNKRDVNKEMLYLQSVAKYDSRVQRRYVQVSPDFIETIYFLN